MDVFNCTTDIKLQERPLLSFEKKSETKMEKFIF